MKDAGGCRENCDALMREYKVLVQQVELRRRMLEQGWLPPVRGTQGIPGGDPADKLDGERKFKRWEAAELTEMAKERLEAEWT